MEYWVQILLAMGSSSMIALALILAGFSFFGYGNLRRTIARTVADEVKNEITNITDRLEKLEGNKPEEPSKSRISTKPGDALLDKENEQQQDDRFK